MQRKTYNHSRVCGQALQRREVKAGHKGDTTARVGEQGKHKLGSRGFGLTTSLGNNNKTGWLYIMKLHKQSSERKLKNKQNHDPTEFGSRADIQRG